MGTLSLELEEQGEVDVDIESPSIYLSLKVGTEIFFILGH